MNTPANNTHDTSRPYDHSMDIGLMFRPSVKRQAFKGHPHDGKSISTMIDAQEEVLSVMQEHDEKRYQPAVTHSWFEAPDHPMTEFYDRYLREDEDESYVCGLSHSVGNTEKGMPELIVLNAEPEFAMHLIRRFTMAWDTMGSEMMGQLSQDDGILVYPNHINDKAALRPFDSDTGTIAAMELRLSANGAPPVWIQLVYSDEANRMPWDPIEDEEAYQPVIGMKRKRRMTGGTLVQ